MSKNILKGFIDDDTHGLTLDMAINYIKTLKAGPYAIIMDKDNQNKKLIEWVNCRLEQEFASRSLTRITENPHLVE